MLSFWATWCDPCRDEIPLMSAIARRHREEGLRLVAVNVGESLAKVSTFAKWPVAGTVLRPQQRGGKAWNAVGLPANYLIDRAARRANGIWANWTGRPTASAAWSRACCGPEAPRGIGRKRDGGRQQESNLPGNV